MGDVAYALHDLGLWLCALSVRMGPARQRFMLALDLGLAVWVNSFLARGVGGLIRRGPSSNSMKTRPDLLQGRSSFLAPHSFMAAGSRFLTHTASI